MLKPTIFGLAVTLSANLSILGAFFCCCRLFRLFLVINQRLTAMRAGQASIRQTLQYGYIRIFITGASTLCLFMIGRLSSTYVKLSMPLQFSFGEQNNPFFLQQVINNIVPGILPLLAVPGIYWWLVKRNQNFIIIMILIIVILIIQALL